MNRFARLVTRSPAATLTVVLLLTLLAIAQIVDPRDGTVKLRIEPSVEKLLPESDEARRFYRHSRKIFGSDETLLVAFSHERLFTPEGLSTVQRIGERLAALEGVDRVTSLFTALEIRGEDDELLIEPFLTEVVDDPAALAAVRERVLANPIYGGNLVSRDGRVTAIVAHLVDMPESEFVRLGIDGAAAAIADEEKGEGQVWIAGSPHVKQATSELLLSDLMRIIPLSVLLASIVAFLAFRTLRAVVVAQTTILVANVWTLGTMARLGFSINLITTVIPALVQTIGFAYVVHVISEYYTLIRSGEAEPSNAPERSLRHLMLALALTAFTTAAGLASLTVSPLVAVREFGILAVIGVVYTVVAAATFAPAALSLGTPRIPSPRSDEAFDRLAARIGRFDLRHRRAILITTGVLLLVSVYGMTRIRVSTDFVSNFAPDHPVRSDYEAINDRLDGAGSLNVVLEADYAGAFIEPANLRELRTLQDWLEAQPEVGASTSLADYVMLLNWGFHDNDPEQMILPDSDRLVDQLLFFGGSDELQRFVNSNRSIAQIVLRLRTLDSASASDLLDRIEPRLAGIPGHLDAKATGGTALLAKTVDGLATGQAMSIGLAFVIIYLVLAALFTSFRIGLVALLPNVVPVAFYFGLLGLTGVTLNVTTALIACLALGIAVDDTIHYFARFNTEARRLADERKATVETLRAVGRPVTITTVALCLGFLALTSAELKNQAEFGAMTAATLAFAWLADVFLTPALCSGLRIATLWDVLTLDLGDAPNRTIPLFQGLNERQARTACLMGHIRHFRKGDVVFTTGETGDVFYVVIDGELSISAPTETGSVSLGTCKRGDVVGEVALFHGTRTANVEATSDVRLLRLSQASLRRLSRRYPRTASVVLTNLARVLAGRLATTTERLT